MTRISWIAASALALALTVTTAHAGKPQPPPPKLVGIVFASLQGCTNYVAVADDGRVLVAQCYTPVAVAATLPGTPVSVYYGGNADPSFSVGLANGDIYRLSDTRASLPWTFTYRGNAFGTVAAAGFRDFPAPSVAAPVTGDPATTEDDTPAAVRPGAEK